MRKPFTFACLVLLALGFSIPGCSETPKPPGTMTNAQGCVRQRGGPQDPRATPPPLMDACLGPYKLRIPANYFGDQMGPYFDGSFGLSLEYPNLNAFAPGERSHLSLDVSTRTIDVVYAYVDGGPIEGVLKAEYTQDPAATYRPQEHLETRIKGEPIYGLTPYYADVEAYSAHYIKKGFTPNDSMTDARSYDDWFVKRDAHGTITTIIKCTSREVTQTGVEYRDKKLVRSREQGLPGCDHTFILPELKTVVRINYVRFALPDWKKIEDRARSALSEFMVQKPNT